MDTKPGNIFLKQGLEFANFRKGLIMGTDNVFDFKWFIMDGIKESEKDKRDELSEALTQRLGGAEVKIQCMEVVGISMKRTFTEHVLVVNYVEVDPHGYGVVITSDAGKKFVPHTTYGIEVLSNDQEDIHG